MGLTRAERAESPGRLGEVAVAGEAVPVSRRRRWLSGRALLLHLEVVVVASGCLVAAWWQATRALGGNTLSWAYSVEWPAFAIIAVAAWWHLIHEDPEEYRARRRRPAADDGPRAEQLAGIPDRNPSGVEQISARQATVLAVGVGAEFVIGVVALFAVGLSRPGSWWPARGTVFFLAHAILGGVLAVGSGLFLLSARSQVRLTRIVGWLGFVGVGVAGAGGLLAESQSLVRFSGLALMFVGSALAALTYMIPILVNSSREVPRSER